MLNYKPASVGSDCKCNRNFGFRASHREKSRFSGAIALIRSILRIDERLYKKYTDDLYSQNGQVQPTDFQLTNTD